MYGLVLSINCSQSFRFIATKECNKPSNPIGGSKPMSIFYSNTWKNFKMSLPLFSMILFICRAKPTAYLEINILHVVVVVVPLPNIKYFKGSIAFITLP